MGIRIKNCVFLYFFAIAFLCWLLPFLLRIFFIETPEIHFESSEERQLELPYAMERVIQLLSDNDRRGAFIAIFKNNLKGCILNIAGGVLLGLGTLFNLSFNGFIFADILVSSYESGLSIPTMLQVTLPHSFELIGFWLSGAIGFYIAWNIIRFMRGKELMDNFYKTIGISSLIVVVIILAAAYVEAFISTNI